MEILGSEIMIKDVSSTFSRRDVTLTRYNAEDVIIVLEN